MGKKRYRIVDRLDPSFEVYGNSFTELYDTLSRHLESSSIERFLRLENTKLRIQLSITHRRKEYLHRSVILTINNEANDTPSWSTYMIYVKDEDTYIPYSTWESYNQSKNFSHARQAVDGAGGVRKIAKALGVSPTTIINLLKDPSPMKYTMAKKLKDMGIDPEVFFED